MLSSILQLIILLSRASLAVVLIAAGAAKLADVRSFAATIRGLGIPVRQQSLIRGLSYIVPFTELVLGVALVSGLWPMVINALVLVLMIGFSVVVIYALSRRVKVSCRCFGMLSDSQFSGKGLARSLLLVLLAIIAFWGGSTYSLQFSVPLVEILLLVAGFLLFGLGSAQAAKSIAELKERMS